MMAALKVAEGDIVRRSALGDTAAGLLSLYNVGWIVGHAGPRIGLPESWPNTAQDPVLGRFVRIPTATPFVTSGRLHKAVQPDSFGGLPLWQEDFVAAGGRGAASMDAIKESWLQMGVNLINRQANTFLMTDLPIGLAWPATTEAAPLAKTLEYRVEPGRVRLVVSSDRTGFIRLAHPFFPTMAVTLNGHAVTPTADIFSMLVLPLKAGVNEIEVAAFPSRLRKSCLFVTLSSMVVLIGIWLYLLGRSRLRSRPMAGGQQ